MNDQELLLLFLGIIAICMFIITAGIIFAIVKYTKTMNKANAFITVGQDGLSTLSSNLNEITKDSCDLLKKVGNESQFLTYKASNGINKLTNASIALKAFSQFFKKNPEKKEDNMNNKNLLSFTIGAAIAGVGAYYVYKNKVSLEEVYYSNHSQLLTKNQQLTSLLQIARSLLHCNTSNSY